MDLKSLAVVSSVFFFGFLENQFPFFPFKQSFSNRTYTNLFLGLVNAAANSFTIAFALNWIWTQNYWPGLFYFIPSTALISLLSFLLFDAYIYFWHRAMHAWMFTWQFHQVHHTDRSMNTSTAYRFHTVEAILSNVPKLFLIWLFGIKLNHLIAYELLFAILLAFQHSNWAIPTKVDKYLNYLIVTPNFHRVHHSQFIEETNSNYASILTLWDRVFKTYQYPKYPEKIQLGLDEFPNELSVVSLLMLPLGFKRLNGRGGL